MKNERTIYLTLSILITFILLFSIVGCQQKEESSTSIEKSIEEIPIQSKEPIVPAVLTTPVTPEVKKEIESPKQVVTFEYQEQVLCSVMSRALEEGVKSKTPPASVYVDVLRFTLPDQNGTMKIEHNCYRIR